MIFSETKLMIIYNVIFFKLVIKPCIINFFLIFGKGDRIEIGR